MNSSGLYSGKRFRQAIQHFLLGRTAQAITFFTLTLWLVRLLDPTDYGAYMVLWGMVEMMAPLSSLGLLEAVRRYLPELAARGAPGVLKRFVLWMTLIRFGIMLIWTILIAIFWLDIAAWMGFSVSQQNATLLAVGLVITVLGFRYAAEMLECLLEQRWSQLTHALMPIGRLAGVALLVIVGGLTLERLLWVDLTVSAGCLLLAEFFLIRRLHSLSSIGDYNVNTRTVASFAWHMAGVNLLQAIASAGAVRILVARTLGLETAGMFAFLQQLQLIVGRYLPANLLANIIRPVLISRYIAGEIGIVKQGIALLWKINLLIIAVSMAAICVAGDAIIMLISSGRFIDAGMVMLVMLLSLGATSQGQLVNMAMQIFPYTRQLRYFSVLFILTPIAVIVGSNWGLIGVVSGTVLNVWLHNNLTLLWLNRQTGYMELDWFGVLRGISMAVLLTALGWVIGFEFGPWWGLALVLLAYGPSLLLVKPLNQADEELLSKGLLDRARFLTPFVQKS